MHWVGGGVSPVGKPRGAGHRGGDLPGDRVPGHVEHQQFQQSGAAQLLERAEQKGRQVVPAANHLGGFWVYTPVERRAADREIGR